MDEYIAALRWGRFERAKEYHRNKDDTLPEIDTSNLEAIKVTGHTIKKKTINDDLDEAVIDHYVQGGSLPNSEQDSLSTGFEISDLEKQYLINCLLSLFDKSYLSEPRFSDPWIDS